jgi:hypothetical protein
VLETSFLKTIIPCNAFNVVSHPPSPIWTQDNEVNDLEENSNQILEDFSNQVILLEENSNFKARSSLSYTPYEVEKFENDEEPPPNAQEDFNQHDHVENVATDDEKPQEHWQQEELVEEINLENNDGQDCHCIKEECFQDIAHESRILDVVGNKEKDDFIFKLETSHPTKDCNTHEKPRIDFIESWFQSIVGQAMQSYFEHIWLNFTSVHFEHTLDSLIAALICSPILEFIPNISWMLEWIHWKSTYT